MLHPFLNSKYNKNRAILLAVSTLILSTLLVFSALQVFGPVQQADATSNAKIKNYIPNGVKITGDLAKQCRPYINDAFGYLQNTKISKSQTYAQYVNKWVSEINCTPDSYLGTTAWVDFNKPTVINVPGDPTPFIDCVNKEVPNHPAQPNFRDLAFHPLPIINPEDSPNKDAVLIIDENGGHWSGNFDPCWGITWEGYVNSVKGLAGLIVHEATHGRQNTEKNWLRDNPNVNMEWDAVKVQGKFQNAIGWQYGVDDKTSQQSYEEFMIAAHQKYLHTDLSTTEFVQIFGHEPAPGTPGVSDNPQSKIPGLIWS